MASPRVELRKSYRATPDGRGREKLPSAPTAAKVAFYGVIVCWWWFGLTFWLRKQPPRARAAKRDLTSYFGMALQSVGYFTVWFFPFALHRGSLIASQPEWLAWTMSTLALSIAVFSAWLVNSAARRLGKQWSLAARIVEDHDLIDDGPYSFVRNPIYTGMFGMLIAAGLIVSRPLWLLLACAIFLIGTYIRVRIEERLLRETFGPIFDEYKRRVPAMIPGLW
jgi:protein-S-isoprenylcysteine O-methyltransferase Ste14